MIQVVIFPHGGGIVGEEHVRAIQGMGATVHVGTSVQEYLEKAGQPFVPPDVMFVDFRYLESLAFLAHTFSDCAFLKEVPTIVIARPQVAVANEDMNIIGRMDLGQLPKPETFRKFVTAFYEACPASPTEPVSVPKFSAALAVLSQA